MKLTSNGQLSAISRFNLTDYSQTEKEDGRLSTRVLVRPYSGPRVEVERPLAARAD